MIMILIGAILTLFAVYCIGEAFAKLRNNHNYFQQTAAPTVKSRITRGNGYGDYRVNAVKRYF